MKMPPDGFFLKDFLLWGEPDQRGFVSKGWSVSVPDTRNASEQFLTAYSNALEGIMLSVAEESRLQIRWAVHSDYQKELLAYQRATESFGENIAPWCKRVREERFNRHWHQMTNRQLRRERCSLWLSKRIEHSHSFRFFQNSIEQQIDKLTDQLDTEFEHQTANFRNLFSPIGGQLTPMTNEDNYNELFSYFNPSDFTRTDELTTLDPNDSIYGNIWQCQHSPPASQIEEVVSLLKSKKNHRPLYGFQMDGYLHNFLVLTKWPRNTYTGIVNMLTKLPLLDYEIIVNLYPKNNEREIKKEEAEIKVLMADLPKKPSLKVDIGRKQAKIEQLRRGVIRPFEVDFIVHLWEQKIDNLTAKTIALKQAINGLESAKFEECCCTQTALQLWALSIPGWTWTDYPHYRLYGTSFFLADMLPFSASFTGHPEGAEALYDGDNRSLVSYREFVGGSPQHCATFGTSGTGKSKTQEDILSQTNPYYAFTCIIEEGLSYLPWLKNMGVQPIIIHPDLDITFNYFDTNGSALTGMHTSIAASLVAVMAGASKDEEKQALRQAMFAEYIDQLLEDRFDEWLHDSVNYERLPHIARCAILADQYKSDLDANTTTAEALLAIKELIAKNDDTILTRLAAISEEKVSTALHTGSRIVRNAAYSWFEPSDFPTHSQLVNMMRSAPIAEHNRDEVNQLATRLSQWCADGAYGKLFDGLSNRQLKDRIVHFELGSIPDAMMEMKVAAGFLIMNQVRQIITTMPRSLRKEVIFEELAAFTDIPGGEKLVAEFYMRLRKYNCRVNSIVQQYATFKNSRIRPFVLGNSSQFVFFKQNDLADLRDQSAGIGLPENTMRRIMNYPKPDQLPEGNRYSQCTYYQSMSGQPLCGTMTIISPLLNPPTKKAAA